MRKKTLLTTVTCAIALPSLVSAATVGNRAETLGGAGKFALGFEYDRVFNRDLDFDGGKLSETEGGVTESGPLLDENESIKDAEAESNRLFLKATAGLHPQLDVFAKLGIADVDAEFDIAEPGFFDVENEFEGDFDFGWGLGAKACLFGCGGSGMRIMADAQYLSYEVDGDFELAGVDLDDLGDADSETEVTEWQVALYANWTIQQWSPYAGVKYSDIDVENDTDVSGTADGVAFTIDASADFEADDNVGIFVGTDFNINSNLSLNIEGRFIDETAGSIGLSWQF